MLAEMITIVVDTACVLLAFGAGTRFANRRQRPPKPKNLYCGCEHVLAYHDPKTGQCNATEEVGHKEAYGKSGGTRYVTEQRQCTCRVYTGDLPDDWYARTLGSEAA